MIIPLHDYFAKSSFLVELGALSAFADNGGSFTQGWASIIGIVTAIVGNILISIALNTQRYAHVRLEKEQQDGEEKGHGHSDGSRDGKQGYGAVQRNIADERARVNAKSQWDLGERDDSHEGTEHDDETDALIPKLNGRKSYDSTSTVRDDEKSTEDNKKKNYLRSPYWWIGIVLMTVGEAGNFLAYGFAPASIVSPLGVVALISNCLIAPIMLKEQFRKQDLLGVIIAISGAVTVVLSAEGSNPKLGPHEIWSLINRWEFLTYLAITVSLIIVLMVASNRYGGKTIMIDIGLVGLFGGYTALSTKGIASLLSYRLWHALTFPITYLLVAILIGTAVMQIKYVNRALQRFNSTQVIPTQFVMFTIFVIVGSAILYRDFEKTTPGKIVQFVGGCILTFFGVWCITSGRDDGNGDNKGNQDEEGEHIDLVDETQEQPKNRPQDPRTPSPLSTPKAPRFNASHSYFDNSATDSPSSFATASSRLDFSTASKPPRQRTPDSSPLRTSLTQTSSHLLSPETPTPQQRRPNRPSHTKSDIQGSISPHPSPTPTPRSRSNAGITAAAAATAPRLFSRDSLAGILPTRPLTSPLSASLSVIVADNLRKGDTQAARRVLRKGTSSLRVSQGAEAGTAGAEGIGDDGRPQLSQRQTLAAPQDALAREEEGVGEGRRRLQSGFGGNV